MSEAIRELLPAAETLPWSLFPADALDWEEVRALLERLCPSSLGLAAVRALAPRSDESARRALARVEEYTQLLRAGSPPGLAGLSDFVPGMTAARKFSRALEGKEWARLLAFLEATQRLAAWLRQRHVEAPELARLGSECPNLGPLLARIQESIDDRGEIRVDASPRLASVTRQIQELDREIQKRIERVVQKATVRPHLSDFQVHRRGGRRVVAVKARMSGRVPGLLLDRSQTGETAFIEPQEVSAASNQLSELELERQREEQRILLELTRAVLENEGELLGAASRMAELELAAVGARLCDEYGARVPQESAGELLGAARAAPPAERAGSGDAPLELVLKEATHLLLLEQMRRGELERAVPIDVRLGGDFDVLIVTGPNTGGKTLAIKTVGLAALLVRLGLPVPCGPSSCVPLFSGLVVDIGDEQEIRQSLSTFSSHLARVRAGLERADERTLVLLDELGGGTDPDEGAALSDAILEELLRRGARTMATTHLGKLKEFAYRHARAENACVEFDNETLAPLYRMLIGTPGESNALAIAQRLGLDGGLIERARERMVRREKEVLELMAQVRGAREEAERVRSETESRLRSVADEEERLDGVRKGLERRGEQLEAEAQRGLEERVREARRGIERARALLEQLPAKSAAKIGAELERIDTDLGGATLTERRREFVAGLAKGKLVYVPRYKQRCVITRVDKGRSQLTVRLGKMALTVPFDEVTWYESL